MIGSTVRHYYEKHPFNLDATPDVTANNIRASDLSLPYVDLNRLLPKTKSMIDFGCGTGWLVNSIAFHHPHIDITGVDFCQRVIQHARDTGERLNNRGKFVVSDIFEYEPHEVDLAISVGVIHHTADPKAAFQKIVRCAKKHAFFVIYHKYGRKAFLERFQGKSDAYKDFAVWFKNSDEIHVKSWFNDQVFHPHETTHTLEEVESWLEKGKVVKTNIKGDERDKEQEVKRDLDDGLLNPGVFSVLVEV